MNKYVLRGVIALSLVVFYFLLSLVVFYFLLGWEPVLRMAGVLTVLVLLRLAGLELTRPERASARRTHERLTDSSAALLGLSFTSIIMFTIVAGVYLFIHFGELTTLLYTVLTLVIASIFEASYEAFEASED
ncbi:MAG TPA: hypothetical protein DHV65_19950 [Ktedonobacter sp.]|jgi:hypothetical protein|nr:hypothetical protein [Ktedonobacter sp.]